MDNLLQQIEAGKQVGLSYSFEDRGLTFWETAAVQLYGGKYIGHLARIKENNFSSESFDFYETQAFQAAPDAIEYLRSRMFDPLKVDSFSTFKGQKAFNPAIDH